jgi:4-amino-4-deoxy-L-arabinose transferase-like glycosyltransferase
MWLFVLPSVAESVHTAGDGTGYHALAKSLYEGRGFGMEFPHEGFIYETFRTPGVPFILSLFLSIGLGVKAYLGVISIVAAMCIPLCTWYIARHLFDERTALIAAFLVACEPLIAIHGWLLLTEVPFLTCFLLGVCFSLRALTSQVVLSYSALYAGILFACAIYIRPAALPLLIIGVVSVTVYHLVVHKKLLKSILFIACTTLLLLTPWYIRVHDLTGVYALSGTGWRNVYTDYLASIRALNNNTRFIDEKNNLKQYAVEHFDITRSEINSPALTARLKAYALPEILDNTKTVVELQGVLFVSYFTHSDYQRRLQKFGVLPLNKVEQGRTSSSLVILKQGIYGIPIVYAEMKNRYFIPIFERVWTGSIFIFAVIGFFTIKTPVRYLFFLIIVFGYLTSSAIGLGVEGRLRIPILPFYFMLASCGMLWAYSTIRSYTQRFLWK